MPKKTKKSTGKKEARGFQKGKPYSRPKKIPEGTILECRWKVGKSIGWGGFADVYSACKDGESEYKYVVKCERSENGPLITEINFYMRHGRERKVKIYQKNHGLKSFGMPHMISHGSLTLNGIEHRYIVMPRYGEDLRHYYWRNGGRLPIPTVYRVAIQMLDVLEYVHQCGYIHADLKAANILLGQGGKNANTQTYLVDFGLAARYDKHFKPDPKEVHEGTLSYASRDAHKGVITMRADLEILGYNLIEWLGAELPWERQEIEESTEYEDSEEQFMAHEYKDNEASEVNFMARELKKYEAAKVQFMAHIDDELRYIFPQGVSGPLSEYMKYVNKLKYNDRPDYKKCRKIFQDALAELKVPDSGDLQLTMQATPAFDDSMTMTKPKEETPKAGTHKSVHNSRTLRKRIASPLSSPSRKKTKKVQRQ